MTEQPAREPFRPRVWWSPTQGVIEQVEPRWPDEPPRFVRTRDRRVLAIPEDAVELADATQYRHLLGCIWLYVDWRWLTRQLTTVQKELWADAVDAFGDPADDGLKAERWWRDDYVDGGHRG